MKQKTDESFASIKMTVTEYMYNLFKDSFNIEIELLQGSVLKLKSGKYKCNFRVEGDKIILFSSFIKKLASHPSMTVTIMGLPINPN